MRICFRTRVVVRRDVFSNWSCTVASRFAHFLSWLDCSFSGSPLLYCHVLSYIGVAQCCAMLCCVVPCCVISWCIVLCRAVRVNLCWALLCCVVSYRVCWVVLCCLVLSRFISSHLVLSFLSCTVLYRFLFAVLCCVVLCRVVLRWVVVFLCVMMPWVVWHVVPKNTNRLSLLFIVWRATSEWVGGWIYSK